MAKKFIASNTIAPLSLIVSILFVTIPYFVFEDQEIINLTSASQSFTFISISSIFHVENCESKSMSGICEQFTAMGPQEMRSAGSGAVVSYDQEQNLSYVLSAEHVCEVGDPNLQIGPVNLELSSITHIQVVTIDHAAHDATIHSVDADHDICLLLVEGYVGPPLPIAVNLPRIGDRVFNVAAPRSIFHQGVVPILDGHYSGYNADTEDFVFTIPAAPGSSGSVILDSSGQIVSVLHSAHAAFENIAIGCSLPALANFVNSSVSNISN